MRRRHQTHRGRPGPSVSPVRFNGSFSAVFPPLVRRAPRRPRPEALLFPRRFFSIVASEWITKNRFSPSYLRLLRSSGRLARLTDAPLRVIALGGEARPQATSGHVGRQSGTADHEPVRPDRDDYRRCPSGTDAELLDAGLVPIGHPHPGARSTSLMSTEGWWIVLEWSVSCTSADCSSWLDI